MPKILAHGGRQTRRRCCRRGRKKGRTRKRKVMQLGKFSGTSPKTLSMVGNVEKLFNNLIPDIHSDFFE
jgi:hypothetical protein